MSEKKKLKEKTKPELITDYRRLMAREKVIVKRKGKIKKLFPEIGRSIFQEDVKVLFEQNPDLHSFQWTQYTDFFNDGEPCTFGVHRWDWCVNDSPSEYDEVDEDVENAPHPSGLTGEQLEKLLEKLEKKVSTFMSAYSDDDLEDMFGDHVRVHVRRDGVTTETYDDHG